MGNAMSDCFDRILPFEGGGYDLIALGLQESTYSIKAPPSSSLAAGEAGAGGGLGGGAGAAGGGGSGSAGAGAAGGGKGEDGCVLQLLAQVKEVLRDDFYMVS